MTTEVTTDLSNIAEKQDAASAAGSDDNAVPAAAPPQMEKAKAPGITTS